MQQQLLFFVPSPTEVPHSCVTDSAARSKLRRLNYDISPNKQISAVAGSPFRLRGAGSPLPREECCICLKEALFLFPDGTLRFGAGCKTCAQPPVQPDLCPCCSSQLYTSRQCRAWSEHAASQARKPLPSQSSPFSGTFSNPSTHIQELFLQLAWNPHSNFFSRHRSTSMNATNKDTLCNLAVNRLLHASNG